MGIFFAPFFEVSFILKFIVGLLHSWVSLSKNLKGLGKLKDQFQIQLKYTRSKVLLEF